MSYSEQPVISGNIERLQQFDEPVNGPLMRPHGGRTKAFRLDNLPRLFPAVFPAAESEAVVS
jgi:hypothetical protein